VNTPLAPDGLDPLPSGVHHVSVSLDFIMNRLHLILGAPEMRLERTELLGILARLDALCVRHNGRMSDAERPHELGGAE
jgi:hypothetical protein